MWDFGKFSDRLVSIDEAGAKLSYRQLDEENKRFEQALGSRSLVFILCSNTIGSLAGYTGCLNGGSVPLLLAQNLDTGLLESLIKLYKPDYLWVPGNMRDIFSTFAIKYGAFGYLLLETGHKKVYPLHDDLCLLLTTSGSTGSPKFVRQSYENVLSNAASIAEYLELDETERPISTLPMNYTYGLSIINSHLLVGAALLFTNKGIMQKEFWNFFKEQKATSFGGVPYTYEMLDRLRFFRMDLPSLRYCTQAGGKLMPELHKKFAENAQEKGTKFIVMYGQCEATARMGYLPAEKALEKYGSMGIAIPGGRFHLIDEEGKTVSQPYVTGELVYNGPNVTMGYAECGADLIKGDERGKALRTGDMAQFDEDGYYYIVGRKKRFLKLYGNRVNLDEIDRLIKAEFHNTDCASAGVDDHLYVFVTDREVAEGVKPFLAAKTGINAAAFKTVVIDEIPKNDAGKTLYKELEKYYL